MKSLTIKLIQIVFFSFLLTTPAILQTPDWPRFRGVNGSGIAAPGENPPLEFGVGKNLLWKTELMPGFSSPCISGDRIFLTGLDQENKVLYVYAIEKSAGKMLWTRTQPVDTLERVHAVSNQANATPATDGERVVVYFPSFGLLCYDFEGNEQWKVTIPVPISRFGTGTSPVIEGNHVLLNLSNDSENPRLEAWDKRDGSVLWTTLLDPDPVSGIQGYSTPLICGDQFVVYRSGEIVASKIETGERVWSCATRTMGTSSPVLADGIIYVGTHTSEGFGNPDRQMDLPDFDELVKKNDADGDSLISLEEFPEDLILEQRPEVSEEFGGFFRFKGFFRYMDDDQDSLLNAEEWNSFRQSMQAFVTEHGLVAIKPGGKGDVTLTHQLWKQPDGIPEVPSPLAFGGRIYEVRNGGIVTCVRADDGEVIYQEKLGASGPYFSSPIMAGDRIYACSRNGVVSVFKAGDDFQLLAQTKFDDHINATPAVVDNVLYVRTDQTLFAFGGKD